MPRRFCARIDSLAALDIAELKSLWKKTFDSPPPAHAKRELLTRLLAYGLQERATGSLSKASTKRLQIHGASHSDSVSGASATNATPSLRLGARLVRGWGGVTHEVTVIDHGFAYRGKAYRSLSEIARLITGAHWSGPRFFGVRSSSKASEKSYDQSA